MPKILTSIWILANQRNPRYFLIGPFIFSMYEFPKGGIAKFLLKRQDTAHPTLNSLHAEKQNFQNSS